MKILEERRETALKNDMEIHEILNQIGLDEDEIESINKRNKLLEETTSNEVNDIVKFFSVECKLKNDDIARIVIKNPLILNESLERINILAEIYEKIGFSGKEYEDYIINFDKAFSLNPKEVLESVSDMMEYGKELKDIRKIMVENANKIF